MGVFFLGGGHLLRREGVMRHSWEEGVGVGFPFVGKQNNDYHKTGDMLNCRRFSALNITEDAFRRTRSDDGLQTRDKNAPSAMVAGSVKCSVSFSLTSKPFKFLRRTITNSTVIPRKIYDNTSTRTRIPCFGIMSVVA